MAGTAISAGVLLIALGWTVLICLADERRRDVDEPCPIDDEYWDLIARSGAIEHFGYWQVRRPIRWRTGDDVVARRVCVAGVWLGLVAVVAGLALALIA